VTLEVYIDGAGPVLIVLPSYGRDGGTDYDYFASKVGADGLRNFHCAEQSSEKRILIAQPGPGQLGNWNMRDNFAQPSDSPNHCVEPVGRAIDRAIPFAAERHHFRF
jgi:hypothetical protein